MWPNVRWRVESEIRCRVEATISWTTEGDACAIGTGRAGAPATLLTAWHLAPAASDLYLQARPRLRTRSGLSEIGKLAPRYALEDTKKT